MHRPPALLFALALAASWTSLAPASIIPPTYTFINTSGGPVARADFEIVPAGSVSAPVIGTDPKTGLPRTASPVTIDPTKSSGFDTNNFSTALGTGASVQGLRLLFGERQVIQNGQILFQPVTGPNGEPPRFLESGGTVTFTLHPDPGFDGAIRLISLTTGVADPTLVTSDSGGSPGGGGSSSGGGTGGDPAPNIPEPMTLILWSSVVGLGALRARRLGR